MKRVGGRPRSSHEIRRDAEDRLSTASPALSGADGDPARLLHELQVHQVELEIQNEELQRSQAALEESHARYWALYDHAPFGYVTLERDTTIVDANRRAVALLGVDSRRLVGVQFSEFMTPADADRLYRQQRAALESGEPETCDLDLRRADGHVVQVRVETAPQPHGASLRFHIVIVDISDLRQAETQLKDSEARFRQLAEHIEDAFYLREPDGVVSYVSPAFERIWGRPAAGLAGRDDAWLETIDPADRPRVADAWSCLREGAPISEVYRIRRPDGAVRWVHSRGFPVEGPDGAIVRSVGVVRDVTNERALEGELRQAQKLEAVGTLAGGVAHNLRNVLHAVLASIEVVQMIGIESPDSVGSLERAVRAAKGGAKLIDQLMTFAHKDEGRIELRPLHVDESIRQTEGLLKPLLGYKIQLAIDTGAPDAVVMADSVQLQQVLLNLAANARDAMPDGGTLTIQSREATLDEATARSRGVAPGSYVILTVGDSGHGMDAETKARIFEPFFTTKGVKGTGLGLSTAFALIRQFAGSIDVESEPGRGTTFSICLPTPIDGDHIRP